MDIVIRSMELQRDFITALEWSLNEITDNVLNHANSDPGGLVQVSSFRDQHRVEFVVADAGRGIPAAMRERFPEYSNDEVAVGEALKSGVTSIPDSGQGNGLAGSLAIAKEAQGSFMVTSGEAHVAVYLENRTGRYRTQHGKAPSGYHFPGTVVTVELSTQADLQIERALSLDEAGSELLDIVDLKYTTESGDLKLRVSDEALGFGTRHAGVELRLKCRNLLEAEPTARLILDWKGVPLVSSSFADEAVGKLFMELGPTTFSSRVSHINAESLVRSLLDRAVMQRVADAMRGSEGDGGAGQ